jgi:hypothetical protein
MSAGPTQIETMFRPGLSRVKLYVGWATQSETKSRLGLYAIRQCVSLSFVFRNANKENSTGRKE